ncbi:SAM-dependent methyltransferase [Streptacidiphilus jiangxiensis]|uniref:Methyltransferase domain-containing protein n=1 Tax=Streptacidiphilus jiangxiensis TaxID=235985 RepID=A0A1H7V889_STRJI|nr:class I SAM-dependent methyltransferase [Streptacidiphilus jiangxiensis]SEM05065.1 Methyltransferase domain-containing protein [Streptacidiphilus jiangxiensis]
MNRDQLSLIAHTHHPIAAPLGDASVAALLDHAVAREDARVLDLGCGSGEWLLRALTRHPKLRAVGVDLSARALTEAAERAEALGVADRLTLVEQDADAFTNPHGFDAVLCVGAVHAFGGLPATLTAASRHLAPGGRLLVGDGYFEREPAPEAREMLGDSGDLPTVMAQVTAAGLVPVQGHLSTRQELDAYEWAWTGSLANWALDHPDDPSCAQALEVSATHRNEWLRVYRDTWGFVTLVLRRLPGA